MRRALLAASLAFGAAGATAQTPFAIGRTAGGWQVTNNLAGRVGLLVRFENGAYASALVNPAASQEFVGTGLGTGTPHIPFVELAAPGATFRALPSGCTAAAPGGGVDWARATQEALAGARITDTKEARDALQVDYQRIDADHQETRQERAFFWSDPSRTVEREITKSYALLNGAQQQLGQIAWDEKMERLQQTVETVFDAGEKVSDRAIAEMQQFGQEKEANAKIAASADSARASMVREAADLRSLVTAGQRLSGAVQADLPIAAARRAIVQMTGPSHRLCNAPLAAPDPIVVLLSVSDSQIAALAGEARFDHGGKQLLVWRRVAGGNAWITNLWWPTSASRAQLMVTGGTKSVDAGSVHLTGPSVDIAVINAQKAVDKIKKRVRELDQLAKGFQYGQTASVP